MIQISIILSRTGQHNVTDVTHIIAFRLNINTGSKLVFKKFCVEIDIFSYIIFTVPSMKTLNLNPKQKSM